MFKKEYFSKLCSWQEALINSSEPIIIYGMGDGCEKVLSAFEEYNIRCDGIFASDDFVRNQNFLGYKVRTLAQTEELFENFKVVMAFGTSLPDVMNLIDNISKKHQVIYPDTPVIGNECFTKAGFLQRFDDAKKVYNLLSDELSKKAYINILSTKITGDLKYIKEIFTSPDEAYENILKLSDKEIYADLGAYTGDTILEFLSHTNSNYKKIYALEPNKKNFRKCVKNIIQLENIQLYNSPAWNVDTVVNFTANAGRQAQISSAGNLSFARSLDSILNGNECTYIKFDVEGADSKAIDGSRKTIANYAPKICTALYHRAYDLIDLPLQIHSINSRYKLYIRQYVYYPCWETNLFATT